MTLGFEGAESRPTDLPPSSSEEALHSILLDGNMAIFPRRRQLSDPLLWLRVRARPALPQGGQWPPRQVFLEPAHGNGRDCTTNKETKKPTKKGKIKTQRESLCRGAERIARCARFKREMRRPRLHPGWLGVTGPGPRPA